MNDAWVWVVAYLQRRRLVKSLGFTSPISELDAVTADYLVACDEVMDELEAKEREKQIQLAQRQ